MLRMEGDWWQLWEIAPLVVLLSSSTESPKRPVQAGEQLQPCLHRAAPVPMHPMHPRRWWCRALVRDHLLVKADKVQGFFEGR